MIETIFSQCQICAQKCYTAVEVDREANRILRIRPDRESAAWRDFCQLGANAPRVLEHPRRLKSPMKRVDGRYVPASYEAAADDIAERLRPMLAEDPDSIGMFLGNPGGLSVTISAYAFGLHAAMGSRNRYLVSSFDNNSFYIVNREMFGSDWFCLLADIDESDCYLYVGTNPAVSAMNWTDVNVNGWKRMLSRVQGGADLIVVDPRYTETAQRATLHLAIIPGQDWAFLLGVIKVVFALGLEDIEACARADGIEQLRELAAEADLAQLSIICGITEESIADVARRFAGARRGHVQTRTGIGQTRNGVLGEWLGQVLNLITDRFDKPGGRYLQHGTLNLTELLDARFASAGAEPSRVRGLATVIGMRAGSEMADEIVTPGPGQMRALLIVGGNPVNSGPQGDALDKALAQLDLLVAVDQFQRESHRHAHWLIPGTHFLERDEFSATTLATHDLMSLKYAGAAVSPPEGVQPEWRFFIDLAQRLDLPLFGEPGGALLPEHLFAGSLAGTGIDLDQVRRHPHGMSVSSERFGHFKPNIQRPDKRVQAAPQRFVDAVRELLAEPTVSDDGAYPLRLISRRRKDMMNSMMVEAIFKRDPDLGREIEIHPADAAASGIGDGETVEVSSRSGSITALARLSSKVRPGVVAMAHGFGSTLYDPAGGAAPECVGVSRNLLVSNLDLDPLSAMPRFNDTAVRIRKARRTGGSGALA